MAQRVSIAVDDPFQDKADAAWLQSVASQFLDLLGAPGTLEVLVTGDQVVSELNRAYLDGTGTTDVLSFTARDGEDETFVWPPGMELPLGEVILCLPQAERQAAEQGHDLRQEMGHLLVHGLLHLLGHNHIDETDARGMRRLEEDLMARVLPDGQPIHPSTP